MRGPLVYVVSRCFMPWGSALGVRGAYCQIDGRKPGRLAPQRVGNDARVPQNRA